MTKQIRRTTKRSGFTADAYLDYFRELAAEYDARAARIERCLPSGVGKKQTLSRDFYPASPAWELTDVCCYTDVTLAQLQLVLPVLFDAVRRHDRARSAVSKARQLSRIRRLPMPGESRTELLDEVRATDYDASVVEERIDKWLAEMFGPCTFSEYEHFGQTCSKPVAWTPADIGAGRSNIDPKETAA